MGYLLDGVWTEGRIAATDREGRFVRPESAFRGLIGEDGFAPEPGRYHLYVAMACPWAHRTLILRALKGLKDMIPVSVVDPCMGADGWAFRDGPGNAPDTVNGARHLHQIYTLARPGYTGKVTVPVLWDRRRGTIVNNESSDIVRMFNGAFDGVGARPGDYYPTALRPEIDRLNARIYAGLNNGVYRAGFAATQGAYEEAVAEVFATLDELEEILARRRYLAGTAVTEADWRLFPTLVRFDAVYHYHFKCNLRRLADYPNLSNYTRALYQVPGVAETVNMEHIRRHYYTSHPHVNPSGIVPVGPLVDFSLPHDRGRP